MPEWPSRRSEKSYWLCFGRGCAAIDSLFLPKMGLSNGPKSSSRRRPPDSHVNECLHRLLRRTDHPRLKCNPHSEQFWEDLNPWHCYIQATAFVRRAEA